ncbi:MAG TPA: response regulator, partial [Burkholderiales bacterium]|nr:response regulator [Burkholderiales bacterium]
GLRRILAFTREITERKRAEQALRQAQKMQALGQLTGGIAHDFNNLLTTIMGYVVLAADRPSAAADTKLESYLAKARRSCESAHDVIQQMLAFSRGRRGQPRPVALQRVIAEAVKLFGPSLPAGVEVETRFEEEIPAVMLDPVHLEQILLNLCLNARDAMNGSGTIRVSAGAAPAGEYLCTACRERAVGAFVEVCVEDSGCGIAPDIVDRIFEPFFTTKAVGKGSGMGLASVHGIVHELGGHIIVDTAPGKGTRFRILFPAHQPIEDKPVEPSTRTAAPLRNLHGHVLVVDDQHAVAAYMSDLLESWGLEATTAESGSEALSLVLGTKRHFDVVITDHVMPGITGLELARELRSRCPDLPVILYTAFKENIAQAELDDVGLCAVLSKPVNPHELFGMLQSHVRFMCSGDTVR